jgi:hypothetical protein
MSLLSTIEYPHWLMITGFVLVAFGFIGFAFAKNKAVETDVAAVEDRSAGPADRNGGTTG